MQHVIPQKEVNYVRDCNKNFSMFVLTISELMTWNEISFKQSIYCFVSCHSFIVGDLVRSAWKKSSRGGAFWMWVYFIRHYALSMKKAVNLSCFELILVWISFRPEKNRKEMDHEPNICYRIVLQLWLHCEYQGHEICVNTNIVFEWTCFYCWNICAFHWNKIIFPEKFGTREICREKF